VHVSATPPQPLATLVNFAHNHDQVGNRARGERLSELVPEEASALPTLLAVLTPAIPMLFFGEEFGSSTPFLYFADWDGELREAVREGRKREFGHVAQEDGRPLPDACDERTFEASRPAESQRDSEDGRRWLEMVQRALHVRRTHFAHRHHLLETGKHTAHRIGETGIQACWRYSDGTAIVLQVNLGATPLPSHEALAEIVDPHLVFSHAWPEGTPEGTWPAWGARWWMGRTA
jgi:1,4-alpha-glucan branching enzyme/maltooligosyltrehalose trehalohydrolase